MKQREIGNIRDNERSAGVAVQGERYGLRTGLQMHEGLPRACLRRDRERLRWEGRGVYNDVRRRAFLQSVERGDGACDEDETLVDEVAVCEIVEDRERHEGLWVGGML